MELVTRAVRQCGYEGPLRLLGDQEIALAGAIDGPGAVLVAGTGAICCGRDGAGNRTRVGGYGYLIDDGGSGYALGRDILHGGGARRRRPRPGHGADAGGVRRPGRAERGGDHHLALRPRHGQEGSGGPGAPAAARPGGCRTKPPWALPRAAAEELALLACTAWQNLKLERGELALTGSILQRYPRIRQGVVERCLARYPHMEIIDPRGSAAWGAARLALAMKEEYERMDMLVHLLDLPAEEPGLTALAQAGIRIRRAMAPDKLRVVDWVKEHSGPSAAGEMRRMLCPHARKLLPGHPGRGDPRATPATTPRRRTSSAPPGCLDSEQGKGIREGAAAAVPIRPAGGGLRLRHYRRRRAGRIL